MAAMASGSPALLVLLLLLPLLFSIDGCAAGTTTPTIRAQRGKPNTNSKQPPAPAVRALVQSTCNATTYYDLCVAALVSDPHSFTADLRGLCAIAVSAAATNASATASDLANATSSSSAATPGPVAGSAEPGSDGRAHVQALLLQACAAKYGEAREALLEARESVGEEAYDYAFVHVSAAAEYPAVCRTLFRRKRVAYPVELAKREEALEHLCTVAIDIITLLA
uniref:Uncharacterized protein n=1 Tax=Avena sativa TaxID=4498 RepID=A0ACD5UXR6_AVESA